VKPKLACWRISNFSLMSVRCVSFRNAPCSRSCFLKGLVNIPSSWPIIRAKTPRREREILGTSHRAFVSSRRAGGRSPLSSSRVVKLTPPLLRSSSDRCARCCCGTRRLCRRRPGLGDLPLQCPAVHFLAVELLDREHGSERQRRGLMRRGVHNEPMTEPDLMSLTRVRSSIALLLRRAILESG
jgi:hypothetical protein